jgi:hypothetical protein
LTGRETNKQKQIVVAIMAMMDYFIGYMEKEKRSGPVTIILAAKDPAKQQPIQILQGNYVKKEDFAIRNFTPISTNKLQITFDTMSDTIHFLDYIKELPLYAFQPSITGPPEVRLHQVPADYTQEDIFQLFDMNNFDRPLHIVFVPYSKDEAAHKIAVCTVTKRLFYELYQDRQTLIKSTGWTKIYLDTRPLPIKKCANCNIIGHTSKNCEPAPKSVMDVNHCVHCAYANWWNEGKCTYNTRDTDHPSADAQRCTTLRLNVRKNLCIPIPVNLVPPSTGSRKIPNDLNNSAFINTEHL